MARREIAVGRSGAAHERPGAQAHWADASRVRELGPALAGVGLPFLLVLYLGLQGGGYDAVVRSEVGLAIWWIVLIGAVATILPVARVPRASWAAIGLLFAFAAWAAIGIGGSESSERTVAEVARIATYLGVFTLCVLTQGRESLRRGVGAVAAAIAVLGVLALMSRLQPGLITPHDASEAVRTAESRLNYPLDYWNGLAALIAVGIPLLLGVAMQARRILTSAIATAAIPALALAAFYTLSRGGAGEIAIALIAFFALYPRRLAALPTAAVATVGATLLVAAATQRDALQDSALGPGAGAQGDEMLAMVLVVCAGVALVQAAIHLARKHEVGPRIAPSRRTSLAVVGTTALAVLLVAVAAGLPGKVSDAWTEFKQPEGPGVTGAARFESASGSGRYQLWQSSLDANASAPLTGIGAGTFEFWEAREGTVSAFVRDAHSLYFETLAELGIVGLALILGLVGLVVVVGVRRSLASGSTERRAWAATATAGCVAFAAAAAIDWAWELAVLPIAFLILAAAVLGPSAEPRVGRGSRFALSLPGSIRALIAGVAAVALIAIAIPMASTEALRTSQDGAGRNELGAALDDARTAAQLQPYAASAPLQEALVAELAGDLDSAASAATNATENEPTNWRTWLTLSRIEAERGRAGASIAAYREARSLNPRSVLFNG